MPRHQRTWPVCHGTGSAPTATQSISSKYIADGALPPDCLQCGTTAQKHNEPGHVREISELHLVGSESSRQMIQSRYHSYSNHHLSHSVYIRRDLVSYEAWRGNESKGSSVSWSVVREFLTTLLCLTLLCLLYIWNRINLLYIEIYHVKLLKYMQEAIIMQNRHMVSAIIQVVCTIV